MKTMMTVDEAGRAIAEKRPLLIAGDEKLLTKLPRGNWIGGSTPYFMSEDGGRVTREGLQVVPFPKDVTLGEIRVYNEKELPSIPKGYTANGFSMVLLPGFSNVHRAFAENSFSYEGIFNSPLVGWVTGFHLEDLGKAKAKVFDGQTGKSYDDAAAVMHLGLPKDQLARANIVNLFAQSDGDVVTFESKGFLVKDAKVNGKKTNLAAYVKEKKIDTKLPLVASYQGAMVNVSFQNVDEKKGEVLFYAPVFSGVEYRLAKAVPNYGTEFQRELGKRQVTPGWSCNCILNFLYAELEGKKTADVVGPITFGEVAYILLNQTMVYLTFEKKS